MSHGIVELAARNNALWCDAVCRAHGRPGEFQETLWLNRLGTPRFYPDAVTVAGPETASAQTAAISSLLEIPRTGLWAVKDSFHCIDLQAFGFRTAFEAEWISLNPPDSKSGLRARDYRRTEVRSEAELADWEQAWAGNDTVPPDGFEQRIFRAALLADPEVIFAAVWAEGRIVGGGVVNRGAGVVGLSNLFTRGPDLTIVWQELIDQAVERFPGLRLVGYESGSELAAAHRAGFESIGPLRVWVS